MIRLSPALADLPVEMPRYDRRGVTPGIAHIGLGAFHRCHQAEYTDDLLSRGVSDWGIIGINIRPPALASLAEQGGLYTRLTLNDDQVEARVIGSVLRVVDSQTSPLPALKVLCDPAIHVVTMTVTEKGYCHHPATGALDFAHPDIAHDLTDPEHPVSLPGLLLRALELRRAANAPLTLISCDNIPANGRILKAAILTLAEHRNEALAAWIDARCAFPGTMVDRISPAALPAHRALVASRFGYDDAAVVVCEPYRQWVIEDRFAGPMPGWDRVGVQVVTDAEPYEILKMRVLNGAQTTLSHLGALCGLEHTFDDMADPVLSRFVEKMLRFETLATLRPVVGVVPEAYLSQSLNRLRNTAIRHRNHQIATDGSQKIVQRLLNPIGERLHRGESVALLSVALAGWMAYLIRASDRFGAAWVADDPYAERVVAIAGRVGHDSLALVNEILRLDGIFAPSFVAHQGFVTGLALALHGLLTDQPREFVERLTNSATPTLRHGQTAGYSSNGGTA